MSVGDRNTCISESCNSSSDSRHDLNGNAVLHKMGSLLTTATKQKGISAFETNNATVASSQLHKHRIGARLRNGMMTTAFTNEMKLTTHWNQIKNLAGYQGVVNKSIALTQKAVGPHGE
tara:strand:- start:23 stop:379 length:357 start_codon:yes stop_codon:yes gene_type:complete